MDEETQFKKITAVIRESRFKGVEKALQDLGVGGLSVFRVRGFGEYANLYRSDWTVSHLQLEIFCPAQKVAGVTASIRSAVGGDLPGDGIIAILPVESFEHIHEADDEADVQTGSGPRG